MTNKDFLELAETRYSVRSFADKAIEEDKLEKILRAAQLAPTAANAQPQRIFVFKSENALKAMRATTPFAFNAPVVLLMCADINSAWVGIDGHNSGPIDAAISLTHMMLEAWDLGIGSCWIRGFDKNVISQSLKLPSGLKPIAIMPMGYPSEKSKPVKGWHDSRLALEEFVQVL